MNEQALSRPKWLILFLIWLMMLVAYMDRVNISVAGPAITHDLGLSKTSFGLVLAAFTFGYALLQFPGGWLADKFGAKPLLVLALLIWSLFTGLTGVAYGLVTLITVRVLFGVGEGIENGAQFKLIGDNFSPAERSRASGIFLSAIALGPAVATPVAAALIAGLGWRLMFYAFAAVGVVVAAVLALLLPKTPRRDDDRPSSIALVPYLKEARTWIAISGYLLFNVAFWGFVGWIPTYLREQRHISLSQLGLLGALPYLSGFLGLLFFGQVGTSHLRKHKSLLVAFCYGAAAMCLYGAIKAQSLPLNILGLSLGAFFLYGGFGPFWGLVLNQAHSRVTGAYSGLVNFGGQIGGFMGQIAIGGIADKLKSFNGALMVLVGALVCSAGCFLALRKSETS